MPEVNIKSPENSMTVFFVRQNTPAMDAFLDMTKHKARDGSIFIVTDEQFESIKKDVICLDVET